MNLQKFLKENKIITTYSLILLLTLVFLAFVNYFDISYPLTVTSKSTSGELAVVGEGKVDIVPDTASVELGIIVNDAKTVDEAQTKINTVNNAIIAGLLPLGINKTDIKTSNYSIMPSYNYTVNPNGAITGYNGNVTVSIKVKDTTLLPQVIEAATKGGANQVNGTNYTVDKPEVSREQARQKAIDNAKEQAKKLADSLGIRLGKVVNIVESTSGGYPIPMYYEKSAVRLDAAMGTNAPVPDMQPGTQTITSTVTLYFEKR